MPVLKSRTARLREPTAYPRALDAEIARRGWRGVGMSVDADELAMQFLLAATQQGDYATASNATPELFVTYAPPHDEPLIGPNFDADHGPWDRAIDVALQEGRAELAGSDESDPDDESEFDEDEELDDEDEALDPAWFAFDDDERWRQTARTGRAL